MTNANHWRTPPTHITLSCDDVHVWCASLDQPLWCVSQLLQTLSTNERMRAERLCFEQDRKHFIVGRGLLRAILGCYLQQSAQKDKSALFSLRSHYRYLAKQNPSLCPFEHPYYWAAFTVNGR